MVESHTMKKATTDTADNKPASELIDARIAELADWRGATLSQMRALIKAAEPNVVEEWKWMGTPVWSYGGIICTGESYKSIVKLTFMKGASLKDPAKLFNSSLDGNARRAIDLHEGEQIDANAFKALIREAVELNESGAKRSEIEAESGMLRYAKHAKACSTTGPAGIVKVIPHFRIAAIGRYPCCRHALARSEPVRFRDPCLGGDT